MNVMRMFDVFSAILLVIGGLNWGLIGFFNFNLVTAIFGEMGMMSRIIYGLVGISGLYQAIMFRSINSRWECKWMFGSAEATST